MEEFRQRFWSPSSGESKPHLCDSANRKFSSTYFRNLEIAGAHLHEGTDGERERRFAASPETKNYFQSLLVKSHGPPAGIQFDARFILQRANRSSSPWTYYSKALINQQLCKVRIFLILTCIYNWVQTTQNRSVMWWWFQRVEIRKRRRHWCQNR